MKTRRVLLALSLLCLFSMMFLNHAIVSGSNGTIVCVDPPTTIAATGKTFEININVSNVVDLYGWEFKLSWNLTLLDAVNITEGPFLKGGGDTFFTSKISNTEGYVLVACTLLRDISGVSGNGTLATVKFYVEEKGECVLDLYDTKLVSSLEQPIGHSSVDGYGYFALPQHDVAVTDVTPLKTVVGTGYPMNISVTVRNYGSSTETFNVTVYYDNTSIGTQTVTNLAAGANVILTFTWTTTGVPKGNYTLSAEASTVINETDTADNIYVDGVVIVTIPGDADGDGKVVLIWDLILFAQSWCKKKGQAGYNPNTDFNNDGEVNLFDLIILAQHWFEGVEP